jgi:uncharacterized membrane protein
MDDLGIIIRLAIILVIEFLVAMLISRLNRRLKITFVIYILYTVVLAITILLVGFILHIEIENIVQLFTV